MHYSGILIQTRAGDLTAAAAEIEKIPNVEVRLVYPESGRLIAVQETADAAAQEEGLRRIQRSSRVQFAALVHHLVDGGGALGAPGEGTR